MSSTKLDILPVSRWNFFSAERRPFIIAGPCSAETREQLMVTAEGLSVLGISVLRAGIWKPRTRPGCFEGVGRAGLDWLCEAGRRFGMKVCTEVGTKEHVRVCLEKGVDMLWIGARTTANPFLMQEISDELENCDIPVLVKNPVSNDIDLWIGALERLNMAGIRKIGVIHRGFSSFDKIAYRNFPGWETAIELRTRYPEMLFIADPSHMAGKREYVPELAQRALDLGLDGLMFESHCDPDSALSDAGQQFVPEALGRLIAELKVRNKDSDVEEYRRNIDYLRTEIDVIDENILLALKSRMDVSREIGRYKRKHNISIIQTGRWEKLLDNVKKMSVQHGLDTQFVISLFNTIHGESVRVQNRISD